MLKPGGVFIASDSLASNDLHHFHVDDTYNPIEPAAALVRLQVVGFDKITVIVDDVLKFIARKPRARRQDGQAHDRDSGAEEGDHRPGRLRGRRRTDAARGQLARRGRRRRPAGPRCR